LISLAALSLALSACTSKVGGNPGPASTPPTSPSSATSNADPFVGMSPCTLLDQALAGEGFPPAAPNSADPKHACSTNKPPFGTVALTLQPGQTLAGSVTDPSKAHTGDVNGRPAIEERERVGAKGGCDVSMEVKPDSRAVVVATLVSRNTDEACTYAGQAATKIEPLLPKTS
jgi:hypothetical protein